MHEICRTLLPDDLVFDIGGHEGNKTADFVARGCRVVVVEPQPPFAQSLRERFMTNKNVVVEECGISDLTGSEAMHISTENAVLSTFSPDWMQGRFRNYKWDQRIEIRMETLPGLIAKHGTPRYIKVDAEGYEDKIIGALNVKNPALSFEFTSEYIAKAEGISEKLQSIGFKHFNFSIGENTNWECDHWLKLSELFEEIKRNITLDFDLWGDIYAF